MSAKKNKETKKEQAPAFNRKVFDYLMNQRFFFGQSFDIYEAVAGLYDMGPPACAIKANLLNLWRQHFVVHESMLEIDCTAVTPAEILTASGHVAKFTDLRCFDVKNGFVYRADHLLEARMDVLMADKDATEQQKAEYAQVKTLADTYTPDQIYEQFQKYSVKAPTTGNDLTKPEPFNLMFATQIGATGKVPGFLRPETAQGIFVNFKRLLDYNGGKLPFAGAQIGQAYRNEISPRSGLLRVREFTLAEIEHFYHPEKTLHPRFNMVKDYKVIMYPRENQLSDKKNHVVMSVGEAIQKKIMTNETLAYFVVRVHMYLQSIGMDMERVRFRQHLKSQMSHYACDCWDAEILNSHGWTECVGIADRSCYDLTQHTKFSGVKLEAFEDFPEGPRDMEVISAIPDKKTIGKTFKADQKTVVKYLEDLDSAAAQKLFDQLEKDGSYSFKVGDKDFTFAKGMISLKKEKKRVRGYPFVPSVIEPSFGIGRIMYCLLEHNFSVRASDNKDKDLEKAVLSLPPNIAPTKVAILPHMPKPELVAFVPRIEKLFMPTGMTYRLDDSSQRIGKKYVRCDEIGIPFAITIDHEHTVAKDQVTLRERDSGEQVLVYINDLVRILQQLITSQITWKEIAACCERVQSEE